VPIRAAASARIPAGFPTTCFPVMDLAEGHRANPCGYLIDEE
jgi:hypothetical protein